MYETDYRPDGVPWALDMNDKKVRGTLDKVLMFMIESGHIDAFAAVTKEFDL